MQVLVTLALSVLGLFQTAALAQTAHKAQRYSGRAVVVRIRNGPVIRGRLIEADTDSIRLEVEEINCPVTLDARDVASMVFPLAGVAKKALPKVVRASASQTLAEVREAPLVPRNKSYRPQVGPRFNQGQHTSRRRRVWARPACENRNELGGCS